MWNNEYATWHAVTLSTGDFEQLLRRTDLVHVAYYLFMRGWVTAVGDSPFQLRLPSVVAISLCAAVVTLIGRRLFGTPAGVTGGLMFAAVPAISRYGQETRSYACVTCAAALATLMLLRAIERPTRARLASYGTSLALAGLLHFVSLTLLPAHFLAWLATTRGAVDRRWRVAFAGGYGLLAVLWLPALASRQSASISWIKADSASIKSFPADMFLSGPVALALGVLATFGLAYLLFVPSVRNRPVALTLFAWAVLPPVFVLATFPLLHLFLPRYVLFVLPAWALLAAVGAYQSGRLIWRPLGLATSAVAIAAVVWVGKPAQALIRESPVDGQPDYRAAVETIRQQYHPGDGVVYNDVFGRLSDLAREAFDYEMRTGARPRDVFLDKTAAQRASFAASECADPKACLKDEPRIWLVHTGWTENPFDEMPAARAQLLKLEYTVTRTLKYSGVDLVLLERRK